MSKSLLVSVIIPVRTLTPYLRETVGYLKKQSYTNFEIIVLPDQKEKLTDVKIVPIREPGPAFKRNFGAQYAQGEILAFLDDDSYPAKDWLEQALKIFEEDKNIVGVCGPTLTPPEDNLYQRASGWVWMSWLGAAGAGVYRNRIMPRREVDDFPSVNLLVRKKDFEKVGGFDINHWPGEDTKLCLDLTKLGKKIIYEPRVLVYHHRRTVFLPHLKQISRYAQRRGFFAKKFPETSFRLGYFLPTLFIVGLFGGPFLILLSKIIGLGAISTLLLILYLLALTVYVALLLFSALEVLFKERNLYLAFLVAVAIFLTHLTYGFLFPFGFLKRELGVVPHKVDRKRKVYVGG
jgi:cellulose synthase/poly-beta-1,6-N-acetylglucosamine synthase-like glycosyltransferase